MRAGQVSIMAGESSAERNNRVPEGAKEKVSNAAD